MQDVQSTWSSRKLGAESSATRAALIDAARRLLSEEGYAAVTSRRVASAAGLKPQLVHYYFRSMDDLLLEVLRLGAEEALKTLAAVLESEEPLRALWAFVGDPRGVNFTTEFMALAARSDAVRAELARYAEQFRRMQAEAITRHLKARGIDPKITPLVVSVLLVGLSNVLVREKALGISLGHAETEALVEDCLRMFKERGEPPAVFTLRPADKRS